MCRHNGSQPSPSRSCLAHTTRAAVGSRSRSPANSPASVMQYEYTQASTGWMQLRQRPLTGSGPATVHSSQLQGLWTPRGCAPLKPVSTCQRLPAPRTRGDGPEPLVRTTAFTVRSLRLRQCSPYAQGRSIGGFLRRDHRITRHASSVDVPTCSERANLRRSQGVWHDEPLPTAPAQDMRPIQWLREVIRALDGDHGSGEPHVTPIPIRIAPRRGRSPRPFLREGLFAGQGMCGRTCENAGPSPMTTGRVRRCPAVTGFLRVAAVNTRGSCLAAGRAA